MKEGIRDDPSVYQFWLSEGDTASTLWFVGKPTQRYSQKGVSLT